jgi:hypothetical protein
MRRAKVSREMPLAEMAASVAPNGMLASSWSTRRCSERRRRFRGGAGIFLGDRIGLHDVAMARSALKRQPARIADPDADPLYGRAAGDDLALCRREACTDKPRDHRRVESMGKCEQVFRDALRNTREQRQCLALLLSEAWFFWRRRPTHGGI